MKLPPQLVVLLTATLAFWSGSQTASAISISFQGALNGIDGSPLANGNYNLIFKIYDSLAGGVPVAVTNVTGVTVGGGIASTPIPVEAAWFNGQTRYLGITIAGINSGQELSPRVLVTAVPYSLAANSLSAPSIRAYGESLYFESPSTPDPEGGFWSLQPNAFFTGQFGIVRYQKSKSRPNDVSADSSSSVVVSTNGSMALGRDVPEAKLDVAGELLVRDHLGNTALHVDSDGNVGVGGYVAHAKFEVYGTAAMTVCQITSDRNAKTEFKTVDTRAVLDKLAALPITTWAYTNAPGIRHIGPVAQDFQEAFALGEDEKHIATVDAGGVALASIKALYEILQQKDLKIQELAN